MRIFWLPKAMLILSVSYVVLMVWCSELYIGAMYSLHVLLYLFRCRKAEVDKNNKDKSGGNKFKYVYEISGLYAKSLSCLISIRK